MADVERQTYYNMESHYLVHFTPDKEEGCFRAQLEEYLFTKAFLTAQDRGWHSDLRRRELESRTLGQTLGQR